MEFGDQEQAFTIGVEEEYQIVDPETRALRGRAQRVLPDARQALGEEVQHELLLSQLETATPICHDLAAVRREVTRLRRVTSRRQRGTAVRLPPPGPIPSRAGKRSRSPPRIATSAWSATTRGWPASSSSAAATCMSASTTRRARCGC